MCTGQVGLFLIMWVLWLLTGTVFYAEKMDLGHGKGFYMAVNTGYSIGWGDIKENQLSWQWFSLFHVTAGASFVGAALGFFADSIVANCNNWYVNAQLEEKFNKDYDESKHYITKAYLWSCFHWDKLRAIVLWCAFAASATIGSCITQDWPFVTGLYFAVSSMSTGGLQALDPALTSETQYFFTGVFAGLGVPLMGVAMGTLAGFFISTGDINTTMDQIREDITKEEVDMLIDLGLADKGAIDKTEFIVLCMVRTGAADPLLIKLIKEYFDLLDEDGSGDLDLTEITRHAKDALLDAKKKNSQIPKKRLSIVDILNGNQQSLATEQDKIEEEKALKKIFEKSSDDTAEAVHANEEAWTRPSVTYSHDNIDPKLAHLRAEFSDAVLTEDPDEDIEAGKQNKDVELTEVDK